jgi:hypothetical protein
MKTILTMALVAGLALCAPAVAAPGQCSLTGYEDFACDVSVDGGGLTFSLPDDQSFVFAHVAEGEGLGYLVSANGRPRELGIFTPVAGQPGCWSGRKDEMTFCAATEQ